jgi:hypothetical protein
MIPWACAASGIARITSISNANFFMTFVLYDDDNISSIGLESSISNQATLKFKTGH